MFLSQQPWVELYTALLASKSVDVYEDLLEPWAEQHGDEARWLADLSRRMDASWSAADGEDLCRLYAVFRVTSTLLLRFQRGRADGTDYPGPRCSLEGYELFHAAMGFHSPEVAAFHPFYHEIVGVIQSDEPTASIELVEQHWPPLMLGKMMFCRGGSIVAGGAEHVVKHIVERSTLYWTYRRKDRPCSDQLYGWGHNSQWRTALRRDFCTPSSFHYNVDAEEDIDSADETFVGVSRETMRELVRHRCLIRTAVDDTDLYPYCCRDMETR